MCAFRSTLMGNCSECTSLGIITYIVGVCSPPKVECQSNHGQLRCPKNNCSDPDWPTVGRIPDSHWDELPGMHLAFDHRRQRRPLRQVRSAPPSGMVKRDPSRNNCSRGTLTKVSDVSDSPGHGLSSAGLIFGERRRDHLLLGHQISTARCTEVSYPPAHVSSIPTYNPTEELSVVGVQLSVSQGC